MGVQNSINNMINSTARLATVGKAMGKVKQGLSNQEAQMKATETLNDKLESRNRIMEQMANNFKEAGIPVLSADAMSVGPEYKSMGKEFPGEVQMKIEGNK